MKISPLKIGLAMIIAGIIWTGFVFGETEKGYDTMILQQLTSFERKMIFSGIDIGYYKVYMPEFAQEKIFVQILDTRENVIGEEMIQTRMSVGYFDFDEDGEYTVMITNVAKNPVEIQIEFGNTNSKKMYASGVIILGGAVTLMIAGYIRIKNYSMTQPEENIT